MYLYDIHIVDFKVLLTFDKMHIKYVLVEIINRGFGENFYTGSIEQPSITITF